MAKPLSLSRKQKARRQFIQSIMLGSGVVGGALLGFIPVQQAKAKPILRPPAALDEQDFLASCIKCGQCVQVCPVQAIKLADMDSGFSLGTPYLDARAQACDFSCDAVQCVLACPTGSLSHEVDTKEQVRMGFARLADVPNCLAVQGKGFKGAARTGDYQGLLRYQDKDRWKPFPVKDYPYDLELCDLCLRQCPIEGAISLEPISDSADDKRRIPTVHDSCVGCGVCEMICPQQPAVIVIDARVTAESA